MSHRSAYRRVPQDDSANRPAPTAGSTAPSAHATRPRPCQLNLSDHQNNLQQNQFHQQSAPHRPHPAQYQPGHQYQQQQQQQQQQHLPPSQSVAPPSQHPGGAPHAGSSALPQQRRRHPHTSKRSQRAAPGAEPNSGLGGGDCRLGGLDCQQVDGGDNSHLPDTTSEFGLTSNAEQGPRSGQPGKKSSQYGERVHQQTELASHPRDIQRLGSRTANHRSDWRMYPSGAHSPDEYPPAEHQSRAQEAVRLYPTPSPSQHRQQDRAGRQINQPGKAMVEQSQCQSQHEMKTQSQSQHEVKKQSQSEQSMWLQNQREYASRFGRVKYSQDLLSQFQLAERAKSLEQQRAQDQSRYSERAVSQSEPRMDRSQSASVYREDRRQNPSHPPSDTFHWRRDGRWVSTSSVVVGGAQDGQWNAPPNNERSPLLSGPHPPEALQHCGPPTGPEFLDQTAHTSPCTTHYQDADDDDTDDSPGQDSPPRLMSVGSRLHRYDRHSGGESDEEEAGQWEASPQKWRKEKLLDPSVKTDVLIELLDTSSQNPLMEPVPFNPVAVMEPLPPSYTPARSVSSNESVGDGEVVKEAGDSPGEVSGGGEARGGVGAEDLLGKVLLGKEDVAGGGSLTAGEAGGETDVELRDGGEAGGDDVVVEVKGGEDVGGEAGRDGGVDGVETVSGDVGGQGAVVRDIDQERVEILDKGAVQNIHPLENSIGGVNVAVGVMGSQKVGLELMGVKETSLDALPVKNCEKVGGEMVGDKAGTDVVKEGGDVVSQAMREIKEAIEEVKQCPVPSPPYTADPPAEPVWVMRPPSPDTDKTSSWTGQSDPLYQCSAQSENNLLYHCQPETQPENRLYHCAAQSDNNLHRHSQPRGQRENPFNHLDPEPEGNLLDPYQPNAQPESLFYNCNPQSENNLLYHCQPTTQSAAGSMHHSPSLQHVNARPLLQDLVQRERPIQEECAQQQQQQHCDAADSSNTPYEPYGEVPPTLSFPTFVDVPGPCDPLDLIDGVLFAAVYLGCTHMLSERNPSKSVRMQQAQDAMRRVRSAQCPGRKMAVDGNHPVKVEVDLFLSTQRIKVLNTETQDVLQDHTLRTISYIADIGNTVVLMARRKMIRSRAAQDQVECAQHGNVARDPRKQCRMLCHVFQSEDAPLIAQAIGQAFTVAYQEFLRINGIDPQDLSQREYSELMHTQDMYNDDLTHFSKSENCRDVYIHKQKGESLGVVIVESGWGSLLPTVIIASLLHCGPAARCGHLNIGDQIMTINSTSLVGLPLNTCQSIIKGLKNQSRVKMNVVKCPPVTMVLIRRPDLRYQLGFSVQNGIICSLMRGGIAERGGVRVGHRIIDINSQSVVATPHEKIVHILSNAVGEIHMKTMPAAMYRLLTAQEQPVYI